MNASASRPRPSVPSPAAVVADAGVEGVQFELVDRLESLRAEWALFAEQGRNVFLTWEFMTTWWEHFGQGRRLLTVACRDSGGELFAILPLYLWRRRPLRVVRFLGGGAGDILGPICRPERYEDAATALKRLLESAPWGCDVFVGENLPGEHDWSARLGGQVIRTEGNPVLRESEGFDRFLARRSSNFRSQVRTRERRLAAHYRVRYRLSDSSTLDRDLDDLFRLHEARFRQESTFGGARAAFHRAFAHRAFERGWLRLWVLELDDRPASIAYGFRFGGVDSFYQAGREAGFQRESLGTTLLAHVIREALDEGINEIALLRGGSPYKYRFATEDHGLESVCVPQSRAGAAALAFLQTARSSSSARRLLRARLEM